MSKLCRTPEGGQGLSYNVTSTVSTLNYSQQRTMALVAVDNLLAYALNIMQFLLRQEISVNHVSNQSTAALHISV